MQHNRRRTTLTMLGMAWGIATVVILLAFGSGFERAIGFDLQLVGRGRDRVRSRGERHCQSGGSKAGSEVRLKLADVDYIRNEVPMVKGVTPIFRPPKWRDHSARHAHLQPISFLPECFRCTSASADSEWPPAAA